MKLTDGQILNVLREAFVGLSRTNTGIKAPKENFSEATELAELGITESNIGDLGEELRARLGGVALNVELLWRMHHQSKVPTSAESSYTNIGAMLRHIKSNLTHGIVEPMVVYVDDEEENIFIFRRKFSKQLKIKAFCDPFEALEFIKNEPSVTLVLTDEFMPGMRGNDLCDAVHNIKPLIKFILITGNPSGDDNLMHRTLRHGRFQDFFNKPLDLENKGDIYLQSITECLNGAWI